MGAAGAAVPEEPTTEGPLAEADAPFLEAEKTFSNCVCCMHRLYHAIVFLSSVGGEAVFFSISVYIR